MEREYDFTLKLLLLGDSSVGKTSILLKFTADSFNSTFITTIGKVLIIPSCIITKANLYNYGVEVLYDNMSCVAHGTKMFLKPTICIDLGLLLLE